MVRGSDLVVTAVWEGRTVALSPTIMLTQLRGDKDVYTMTKAVSYTHLTLPTKSGV